MFIDDRDGRLMSKIVQVHPTRTMAVNVSSNV